MAIMKIMKKNKSLSGHRPTRGDPDFLTVGELTLIRIKSNNVENIMRIYIDV